MDEIAEKQRQRERELEEKEKKRREELLVKSSVVAPRPADPSTVARPSEPVPTIPAVAAPTGGKYVPRFKRQQAEGVGQAPPPETDKWAAGSRMDDRLSQPSDRWRDDRRPSYGGGASRSTWSSSRNREH